MTKTATRTRARSDGQLPVAVDWRAVARLVLVSREIDRIEETELVPERLVAYQFSARGHELAQVLLAVALDHPHDAAAAYYRSRPFVLACGLLPEEAFAATMGRVGSPNSGRDIGVVHSLVARGRATVLPVSGDVGAQYSPAAGWAHGVRYRAEVMGERGWKGAIAAALGGDGSTATPGFWSALTMATTAELPLLLLVEDNRFAISVPSRLQCPGANIAANLASFGGLLVLDGDGTDPVEAATLISRAVGHIRSGHGPALVRLSVPRICGHSFADNQAYKSVEEREAELARDPLPKLRAHVVPEHVSEAEWTLLEAEVASEVAAARDRAKAQIEGAPEMARRYVFFEPERPQDIGGTRPEGAGLPVGFAAPSPPEPVRINMIDAIRQTLIHEMDHSERVLVFGEDVGVKGGVHGATREMQRQFGDQRVFDTPLCEEGIIGRAVGLAYAGLIPVPEIQFRKYADPATEQLNDCGTIRWRTAGRFAAPIVVRIPVGISRATGDPWHSVTGEAIFAHTLGWRIAFPSNAQDAVGLLRTALRGDDPTYFLEHRTLYDGVAARRPYPGDDYQLPFGQAAIVQPGTDLSVITWGDMVHHCLDAVTDLGDAVELIDLRTIVPWDRVTVLDSVRRTGRCLVVHEDTLTAGFGAEIAATVAAEAFAWLDAPVERLTSADCPVPYSPRLLTGVVPGVETIRARVAALLEY